MAHIPDSVRWSAIIPSLREHLLYQGKVRDTYNLPSLPTTLAQVARDTISIFDKVLKFLIPGKGESLTAITHFMFTRVLGDMPNHLIHRTSQKNIDMVRKVTQAHPDIPMGRTLFVRRAQVFPVEMIFRAMLGGSGYQDYLENNGVVAGVQLPPGIAKWSKLPAPLFTPSTKSTDGSDINITQEAARELLGIYYNQGVELCAEAYRRAYVHAETRGFILLDSKKEIGMITGHDGEEFLGLVDEVFTPDSSRYTGVDEYAFSMKNTTEPESHDKEKVRQWGKGIETPFRDKKGQLIKGINKLDPKDPEHLAFIAQIPEPRNLIAEVAEIYPKTAETLIGTTVKDYRPEMMF